MSFNNFARKVRDPALPLGLRVSILRSCVQLYRPIGFHATLSFLASQAGDFNGDEVALLRALDVLEASRDARTEGLRIYGAMRRQEKVRGRRIPRVREPNPNTSTGQWHRAPQEAALHAVGFLSGKPDLLSPDDLVAVRVGQCVTASLASGGLLEPVQLEILEECVTALRDRRTAGAYQADAVQYFKDRDLLTLALHVRTAAAPHDTAAVVPTGAPGTSPGR
ncbi:hypothetical protein F4556_007351 [Kitasatospora gansuensis]|uniref:Uncharacterized protein n=1 Tax=Kitasatospora gansuensis TaxID=258050 RepID=A0A7W7SJW2_9ACTN|nr:hypothetical protein [Kitasatospora gansuensis]MBB4951816.1 hypothetical protein [Kitasatospora gansuensis]